MTWESMPPDVALTTN